MNTTPTDLQFAELYRSWWKDSYGTAPNSQATVVAIAWAKHVLNVLATNQEQANE